MTYFQYFLSQQPNVPPQINHPTIRDSGHSNDGCDETQSHSSAASGHFQQDTENHASSMKDTRSDNQTADRSSKSTRSGIISRPTPYPFGNTSLLPQSSSASRPISISDCSDESAGTSTIAHASSPPKLQSSPESRPISISEYMYSDVSAGTSPIAGASSNSPSELQSSPEARRTSIIGYSDESASTRAITGASLNAPPELNIHPVTILNKNEPPPKSRKRRKRRRQYERSDSKKRRRQYDQEANTATVQIFRVILWPKLETLGWTKKVSGSRECDNLYTPPGVSTEAAGMRKRGVRRVLECLASNNNGHLIDQAQELYKLCQEQKSHLKAATLLPDDVQLSWIANELTKNRSEFANWNIPRVSPSTDWGLLPKPSSAEETSSEIPSRKSGRVQASSQKVLALLAGTVSSKNGSEDHDESHASEEASSQNTSSKKQVTSSVASLYQPNAIQPAPSTEEKNRENPSRKSGRVRVPSQKVLAGMLSSKYGSEDHGESHDSEEVSSQKTSSNKQVTSSVAWLYQPKAKMPDVITVFKHVMWPRLQTLGWKDKTEDGVTYYILPGVDMAKQYCRYNRHYFDQVPDILRCVKKQWSKNEQAILSMQLYEACQQELINMEKSGTLSEQVNFDLLMKKVQRPRRK
eukprot:CAMPEP_0198297436 /NCGR_PEP_ID=MMETSP1449-20131203/36811_1 /TAXON_ID=420275 /ORGANISM="Attheya septentrionalis, Strain CCMP2084" /LENGTH=637 /DNA_ID=CAMNT_0043998355 /DNA_START=143 /DNA_END=2056 /DNA_ORIENTATION=+